MKHLLEGLLPRLLPGEVSWILVAHEGKTDLQQSIPRKLRAFREPGVRFVVVQDQDRNDCKALKQRLLDLCAGAGRPDTLVRIACCELEAWYLGDLAAVDAVFGTHLAQQRNRAKWRDPDRLSSPADLLEKTLATLGHSFGKTRTARALGPLLDLENDTSASFAAFVSGVRRLVDQAAASPEG